MVKRRDLVKEVKDAGFESIGGTKHETFTKQGKVTRIPRHKEISDILAKEIRKQAGII